MTALSFAEIKGQDQALTLLKSVLAKRPTHCYLFTGPEGVGKKKTALSLAQYLNCPHAKLDACGICPSCVKIANNEHPDVFLIEPLGSSIKLEQVHSLTNLTALRSFEGGYQVIIIDDAHLLTEQAANSLLKILEEPKEKTVFILVTSKPEAILSTIRSRACQIKFNALSPETIIGILGDSAKDAAYLAAGSVKTAQDILHDEEFFPLRREVLSFNTEPHQKMSQIIEQCRAWKVNKAKALLILSFLSLWYRDLLIFRTSGNENLLINRDCLEEYKNYPYEADWIAVLELLRKYQGYLKQNVSPELTLIVCFSQISSLIGTL